MRRRAVPRRAACDLTVTQGCRCSPDPEHRATVWFPLPPECPCDSNVPEEATVPPGNTEGELDPWPRPAPFDTDPGKDAKVTGHESRVPEIDDRQQAILVIPEPSRRNSSAAANSHLKEDGTSLAPEAGE